MKIYEKNRLNSWKKLFFLTVVGPTLLFGFEEAERVPLGTREMSPETLVQIQERREVQANSENCDADPLHFLHRGKEEARCGFIFDRYPPVYFPASAHWLAGVSAFGDSVELQDGSIWKICSYDGYKALNWRTNDPLLITQNSRLFSSYEYRIINKNTGSSLEANLFAGPIKNGPYTFYFVQRDPIRGGVILNDNSRWEISSYDSHIFRDWLENDAIIIGYNSGWDANCDTILINVNMNNFVRARQY